MHLRDVITLAYEDLLSIGMATHVSKAGLAAKKSSTLIGHLGAT